MATHSPRRISSLDAVWLFHLGDINPPLRNAHIAAYMANKAGWARGAAKGDYDDSDWREVNLPHDWSIEGSFEASHHLDSGFLPRGIGWYRRHFRIDESSRGKSLAIRFDSVATHCTVYLNGHAIHRNFCGYTPFTIDVSDIANFGESLNTLAVRVDATTIEGWWYEGAGIYRHVWLVESSQLHFVNDGVFVRPEKREGGAWETHVEVTIANGGDHPAAGELLLEVVDAEGEAIARAVAQVDVLARSNLRIDRAIAVRDPALWSIESPRLYTLRATIRARASSADVIDEVATTFGYRTIRFDAEQGFFLNDKPVKLLGTCNHQDHAGVGVAVPDSIQDFRIRRLKEMGSNAYRSSHNPPAPQLLDACDRLGMLVIDENRNFGSSPEHLAQLRAMVLRDRNHPCVILWSLCNEEAIQATAAAENITRTMADVVRKLDPSRPITAAVSGGVLGDVGISHAIDVMGVNYQIGIYDAYHAKHPHMPLIAAETHSTFATRGVYETDAAKKVFAADDSEKAAWGATARETWRAVRDRPFVAGMFAWTGFDYRGEPTPHEWPCVNSHFGILDLCGFEKDAFFLHKAFFTSEPFVHLLPHWNWPGSEGREMDVKVYTNCDEAELFLNGESLGRTRVDPIEMAHWRVPYQPGELKAAGYRNGQPLATAVVHTTGRAVALGLEVHPSFDQSGIVADGACTIPVTVFATDSTGRRVPTSADCVTFTFDGPARILGTGNGDPTCHEPNQGSSRSLFNGLAQVLMQMSDTPGEITITATAANLHSAVLRISPRATERRPQIAIARPRRFVTDWRMSPITPDRPGAAAAPSDQDMNTWERISPADGPQKAWTLTAGYAIYRATFTPPKRLQATGGRVVFHEVLGHAEVYLNGLRVATTAGAASSLEIPFAPSGEKQSLAVSLRADAAPAGLSRAVELLP